MGDSGEIFVVVLFERLKLFESDSSVALAGLLRLRGWLPDFRVCSTALALIGRSADCVKLCAELALLGLVLPTELALLGLVLPTELALLGLVLPPELALLGLVLAILGPFLGVPGKLLLRMSITRLAM